MVRRILIFAVLTSTLWAATPPQRRPHVQRAAQKAAAAAAQVAPAVPAQPAPPLTPEQQPPSPPQVAYQNGQLSIVARNSTLRDILMAVGQLAGARVDIPPGLAGQRIFTDLGPGPARDVVASLLSGSPDDYIILGSETTPGGIASIMLTPRQGGAMTASAPMSSPPRPQQNLIVPAPAPSDDDQPAEAEPANEAQPEPMPATGPPPGMPVQPPDQQAQPETPANPNQPGQVKTPEQLLQELQRMQQQQQQQRDRNRVPHQPQ